MTEQERADIHAELDHLRGQRLRYSFPPIGGTVGEGSDRHRIVDVLEHHIGRLERLLKEAS